MEINNQSELSGKEEKISIWEHTLRKYKNSNKINNLIFVRYKKNSDAILQLYNKKSINEEWIKTLECNAYVGKNGLGKIKEGDKKTPQGEFGILTAFGIKQNPGTRMKYINITEDLYSCTDKIYYNKIINTKLTKHNCNGEHLIEYSPEYDYSLVLDYNKECIFGKGSSIFLHCIGKNKYTEGCIAINENYLKIILEKCDIYTKICIFKEDKIVNN